MKRFEGAELRQFYDARYVEGYMEDWPDGKKARVARLLKQSPLPARGRALDFGCGQGVFTRVLCDALPGWDIVGTEVSPVALRLAAERVAGCAFVGAEDVEHLGPFDLAFTHHVLEHVLDVDDVLGQISRLMAPGGWMLHILPCGNPGSFEQKIARRVVDGIRPEQHNTFFFEDAGHLRRLASGDLIAAAKRTGWEIRSQFFGNHFWGAIEWMTALDASFVRQVAPPARACTPRAAAALLGWQLSLAGLQLARRIPGSPVSTFLKNRAEAEWMRRHADPAGSEMYLLFQRVEAGFVSTAHK